MKYYAVLDTNVLVSALLNGESVPAQVVNEARDGDITPLYSEGILAEYEDVLHRAKFPFEKDEIDDLLSIIHDGVRVDAGDIRIELGDRDDIVFYAVVMEKRKETEAYLVTGNMRHFPKETFVVTPREMIDIIEEGRRKEQK